MPTWLAILLAVVTTIGLTMFAGIVNGKRTQAHLSRLFAGRDRRDALASCIAAFPTTDDRRVRNAYEWVQALVNFPDAPIHANDGLWSDLHIDQGDADDLFESSGEWKAQDAEPEGTAIQSPPKTVRDLMAQVLWFGYEGYVAILRSSKSKNAA